MKESILNFARRIKRRAAAGLQRRRFVASVRPSDLFVVTYPKSGTVWLNFLLANALHADPSEPLDLESYHKYVANINRLYFEHKSLESFASRADPRVFWVHARYDAAFPAVIYVMRDPRDALVSYWHWKRMNDTAFRPTLREFVLSDDHWPCRWDEHVASWLLEHRHPRLLTVRYEELHRDTAGVLRRVLEFIEAFRDEETIQRAVTASSFERMKSLEDELRSRGKAFGVTEKSAAGPDLQERFVRRGKVGTSKKELDEECLRLIEQKYGSVMRKVGYLPAA